MAIPFFKEMRIGGYLLKQKLLGRKRYPLVLMLEPLFRCNLACVGCGKIDYPDAILNRRMSAQECWDAADECGAPMVAIPGGEPLIHKEIGEIVRGLVARKKFVSLCTNALLLEKKLDLFEPSPYLFFSVHLDGLRDHHDKAVSQQGVFDRAVSAIKAAKERGFTVNVNATIFDGHPAEEIAALGAEEAGAVRLAALQKIHDVVDRIAGVHHAPGLGVQAPRESGVAAHPRRDGVGGRRGPHAHPRARREIRAERHGRVPGVHEGDRVERSIECIIFHHADFVDFDIAGFLGRRATERRS